MQWRIFHFTVGAGGNKQKNISRVILEGVSPEPGEFSNCRNETRCFYRDLDTSTAVLVATDTGSYFKSKTLFVLEPKTLWQEKNSCIKLTFAKYTYHHRDRCVRCRLIGSGPNHCESYEGEWLKNSSFCIFNQHKCFNRIVNTHVRM